MTQQTNISLEQAVEDPELFKALLANPAWRLNNLYKIIIKGESEGDDLIILFKINRSQRRFMANVHNRNIILKARQLGFTTLIAIWWLDTALFNANTRCGIIAQDKGAAEVIFRDKVKFAYENLPPSLKEQFPLKYDNTTELLFAHNNSSVRVATSMRSGTVHRLHISEFGKICAKTPEKAKEVVTGSIPSVPASGIVVIESTAEGREGEFFDMTQVAIKNQQAGKKLSAKDYKFHFFAWHQAEEYRMDPAGVIITDQDNEYFYKTEAAIGKELDAEQRAWYVATRETDFAGSQERMLQEYPSTPDEAFQRSTDGNYYVKEMAAVRKSGRICKIPELDVPVNTFWDIGNSAGTAIWLHQTVGLEDRFIGYIEGHNETYSHFVKELNATGFIFNKHFLPHDAGHARQGQEANKTTVQMLEELGLERIEVVDRVESLDIGIQITKKYFGGAYFDESCKDGISRLDNYKRKWDAKQGRFTGDPQKNDGNSEGADALRQWAQAKDAGLITIAGSTRMRKRSTSNWKTA